MVTESRRREAKATLGLPEGATVTEAIAAHRRLVFEVHPDREPDLELRPAAEERLKRIYAARDILTEPEAISAPESPRADAPPEPRASEIGRAHV